MAIKSLEEFIKEASINAKKRNVNFAKKMFTKGGKNGGIGSFAILTAENPDARPTDKKENQKLLDEMKKMFKRDGYIWITIEGHYEGNKENSLLVFNIRKDAAARYAGKFEQKSFFWCESGEKSPVCEYWEKSISGEPYHMKKNPYKFINKTDIIHNEKDAEDNYTIIGDDYKFNIDASVFDEINNAIEESAGLLCESMRCKDVDGVLERVTNTIGQYAVVFRTKLRDKVNEIVELV